MDSLTGMLLDRRADIDNDAPPPRRSKDDNLPTLLFSWWCTIFAFVIILTRVLGRYIRTERLFREDLIMALSIIPLFIRMGLVHVILLYGTNNVQLGGITAEEVRHRETGSRLVLASRIFYAMYIWIAKATVSEFLKRITRNSWNRKSEIALRVIRWFLVITFIGVIIGTLAECQPFDHYWQVVPDPGPTCRNGYVQLLTMGISDIITDLLLVFFPIPLILRTSMPLQRKISLCLLFSLSLILLAIAAYRMPAIAAVQGLQQRRSLWASIEILAAALVANSVIIGSFVRDRGVKKGKFKNDSIHRTNSADHPSINRALTRQHWGDDEDVELFRSVGCRLNSVASGMPTTPVPRAPEKVDPVPNSSPTLHPPEWSSKKEIQATGEAPDLGSATTNRRASTKVEEETQAITLLDVGGILNSDTRNQDLRRTVSPDESILAQDFANVPRHNGAAGASIRTSDDSSTALSPTNPHNQDSSPQSRRRPSTRPPAAENLTMSNGRPTETDSHLELNDAGGLLS